ncbi:hypothetical protein, partial [Escherichia coli]|uniref:hypothetical protein n=1 Tax=Escherichia coli TaxID=562 RepID=UPI0028DDA15C
MMRRPDHKRSRPRQADSDEASHDAPGLSSLPGNAERYAHDVTCQRPVRPQTQRRVPDVFLPPVEHNTHPRQ